MRRLLKENITSFIMNKRQIVAFVIIVFIFVVPLCGQEDNNWKKVAGEYVQVDISSATVRQWFDWIEKNKGIVLSYNASLIDLDKICKVDQASDITIEDLLKIVLSDYRIKIACLPSRKLAIQVMPKQYCNVSGTVYEEGSGERLYGAVVEMINDRGEKIYTIGDENGNFYFYIPEGKYRLLVSYMGYSSYERLLKVSGEHNVYPQLCPLPFEIDEVTVKSHKRGDDLDELSPVNLLSISGNDLFSQIWILPGVTGISTGANFQVDGGGADENQLLLDGVPVYHPGHINSLFSMFNGDAVKNIVFYKGYFPTRFEGKLSSVTDVKLKEGNKQEHVRTLGLDMPAASITLEGPLVKDKLSYIVSGRRSWLDFFDNLFSEENRMNHSSYDYNAKLSYRISSRKQLEFFTYGAKDEYHLPDEDRENLPILQWTNRIYQIRYNTVMGRLGNTTSLFYSSHQNKAHVAELGFDSEGYAHSSIKSANFMTEFNYSLDNIYSARWGAKYSYEIYDLTSFNFGEQIHTRREPINQYSLFYDNQICITQTLQAQIGVHFVGYQPLNHHSYYSIQPRFSLRYSPTPFNLFYMNFSKMEQFYHYLRFENIALPTDFRMPSIDGYKPRSSEHYEVGWKHFLKNGQWEISAYYKTRRNVLALRPETYVEDSNWKNYIMEGRGNSYGFKFYLQNNWNRWMLQLSYTYARSLEEYDLDGLKERGKIPSLYDIPHQFGGAVSYKLMSCSSLSIGGMLYSGKIIATDSWSDPLPVSCFRTERAPMNYKVDAGYSYKRNFREKLLLLRFGFYNIIGNLPEEDMLTFYSVSWNSHCIPYGSISFRF